MQRETHYQTLDPGAVSDNKVSSNVTCAAIPNLVDKQELIQTYCHYMSCAKKRPYSARAYIPLFFQTITLETHDS